MFRNLHTNESGLMLVTVLIMTIIMITLAIGLLGLNVGQVTTSEREVERIQARQLAIGSWWMAYSNLYTGGNPEGTGQHTFPDGKTFTITTDMQGPGPGQSNAYRVQVTY